MIDPKSNIIVKTWGGEFTLKKIVITLNNFNTNTVPNLHMEIMYYNT